MCHHITESIASGVFTHPDPERAVAGEAGGHEGPGPPLGLNGSRPPLRLVLEEGAALVAFTEGLLERHERDLTHGQERLLATLATMAGRAASFSTWSMS